MGGDFTFIHAADIHLDSPLSGLARRDEAFSSLVRGSTRRAFANIVDLAIDEGAKFVVIAGDLYDGSWKDQSTGQFATGQLARLAAAGIRSVIVFGNHDAESRITRHLTPPDGVHKLKSSQCETVTFDDIGVAIHGRSYKEAATTENIAATYCPPTTGMFNVALLHTALAGHANHQPYAPCSVDELRAKGHDYWALGHVHDRVVHHEHPWIVHCGNSQGRTIRETGAKGAVVVRVRDGHVVLAEHRPCDEVRWALVRVDAANARDATDALSQLQAQLRSMVAEADGRPVAARVVVSAGGNVARAWLADSERFDAEVRSHAEAIGGELWIEKVKLDAASDPSIGSLPDEIVELLRHALDDPDCARAIGDAVSPIIAKLPQEADDPDTAPLLAAARARDHRALIEAAQRAVSARLAIGGQ